MTKSSSAPKISVIMPVRNGEKYVESTLKTLLGQTYEDWEAVIVDGGSNDGTLSLLDKHASQDPRLRVIREKCQSPYEAIWKGIHLARGRFIYILCFSDGYLTNEWYARCMEVMERDSDISLIWGIPFDLFDDSKKGGKEVLRPHYIFSHFLEEVGKYERVSVIKRIAGKINIFKPSSIIRFLRKINTSNIAAVRKLIQHEKPPAKEAWFSYWLETGTIFPDGNICVARNALLDCFPPYQGADDLGDWEDFFFSLNTKGYLSQCIPIPANYGRLNPGQISEIFSARNDNNRLAYFERLKEFRKKVKEHPESVVFRDREGNPIAQGMAGRVV